MIRQGNVRICKGERVLVFIGKTKGRKAVNTAKCVILYENLWRQHPKLIDVLKKASGLSDMFATKGCSVNQAQILWKIRNEQMINSWDRL